MSAAPGNQLAQIGNANAGLASDPDKRKDALLVVAVEGGAGQLEYMTCLLEICELAVGRGVEIKTAVCSSAFHRTFPYDLLRHKDDRSYGRAVGHTHKMRGANYVLKVAYKKSR